MDYLKLRNDLKNYLQIALTDTNPTTLEKVLNGIDDLYHKDMIQLKNDIEMERNESGIPYPNVVVPAGEWVIINIDTNDGCPEILVEAEPNGKYDGYSCFIGLDVADYYLGDGK